MSTTAFMNFSDYHLDGFYDEILQSDGTPHPAACHLVHNLEALSHGDLKARQQAADRALVQSGITFNVYSDNCGVEKTLPFDLIPRIVSSTEWDYLEAGLKQRVAAINRLIDDLYHDQKILKDKVIPREVIESSRGFHKQCIGLNPPRGIWCHITGTDLVRDSDGQFYVLEDNLRCPSGISYVLENRRLMKSLFPEIFAASHIEPVTNYPNRLRDMLEYLAPASVAAPRVVVLTPGIYNSAYFEHSFLAQQMGVELVEGGDLVVADDCVWVRTTSGFEQVDVIYRRVDDDFLDPKEFRCDSLLGVPGLMSAYRKGNVALANAPGTGVADDKAVYAYIPRAIKYYLGQAPIIPNVHTYICAEQDDLRYVLEHIDQLVVKAANESGGYGMLIGRNATKEQHADFAARIRSNPRNYIAQPTLSLSRVPTLCEGKLEGRHVDLRPYILCGRDIYVQPGGLTRVALTKGSLVVNSSQGGGTKDTWILAGDSAGSPAKPETSSQSQSQSQSQ
jgi:uncharacterized circularly permuted ATP-grasp superfamily protein